MRHQRALLVSKAEFAMDSFGCVHRSIRAWDIRRGDMCLLSFDKRKMDVDFLGTKALLMLIGL